MVPGGNRDYRAVKEPGFASLIAGHNLPIQTARWLCQMVGYMVNTGMGVFPLCVTRIVRVFAALGFCRLAGMGLDNNDVREAPVRSGFLGTAAKLTTLMASLMVG